MTKLTTNDPTNKTKYCECGCGQPAPIAKRYIRGHNKRVDPLKRFWANVDKNGPMHPELGTQCWIWTGSLNHKGYGNIRNGAERPGAHKFSWELHYGPAPDNVLVCHHCDRPNCVRPDHLFSGTNEDNMADMVNKDRQAKGEQNPKSKLTEADIIEIRKLYKSGLYQHEIADKFGVSAVQISRIVNRKSWAWVE